jgi:hypothetical protein
MPDDRTQDTNAEVDYAASWLRCQLEAQQWVAPGGKLIEDTAVRNRRISAAYATLWLADHRCEWAGLAAFASSQVGCDIAGAADTMQDAASHNESGRTTGPLDWLRRNGMQLGSGLAAGFMRGQLAMGNLIVFLDVYPLHRFFMLHGAAALNAHLRERASNAPRVIWPAECPTIPFGQPFAEIAEAFSLMEQGVVEASVIKLAWHEQVNILQPLIYDDAKTRLVLDANQLAWAVHLPHVAFQEIMLPFDSQCGARSEDAVLFSRLQNAHLYDPVQRMEFVTRAATRFHGLLHGLRRVAVEDRLRAILAHAA